jgi:hypothetical protein
MTKLFDAYLPIVQELNNYGGNFTAHMISRPILDAIDKGAEAGDASLGALHRKLLEGLQGFKGLQDHKTFSALFEAFYEGVFYLVAARRGVSLTAIPAGSKYGKTPDFKTTLAPEIGFEVKTIDVADPTGTYDKTMAEGLEAKIGVEDQAKATGFGIAARTIAPHGPAKDRREAVEQVMRKIDGNVKQEQYVSCPTFLVVATARTSLHDRADNLRRHLIMFDCAIPVSGQLFAVAAHPVGDDFYFFFERPASISGPHPGEEPVALGPLQRNGILLDHPFIAGLIFLSTKWNKTAEANAIDEAYRLNGVWNLAWEASNSSNLDTVAAAKSTFERLCHAYNDTDDTRSVFLKG